MWNLGIARNIYVDLHICNEPATNKVYIYNSNYFKSTIFI